MRFLRWFYLYALASLFVPALVFADGGIDSLVEAADVGALNVSIMGILVLFVMLCVVLASYAYIKRALR